MRAGKAKCTGGNVSVRYDFATFFQEEPLCGAPPRKELPVASDRKHSVIRQRVAQAFTFFNGDSERLLHQYVFPRRQRFPDQRNMKAIVHRNDDQFNSGIIQQIATVSIGARGAQPMGHFCQQHFIAVGDRLQFNVGGFRDSIRVSIQRDWAAPNYADPDFL